jgi:hypothetical protein
MTPKTARDEERVRTARRQVAAISWVAAIIAMIGFVVRPDLAIIWAFLFVFSVATVPRWIRNQIREHRKRRAR